MADYSIPYYTIVFDIFRPDQLIKENHPIKKGAAHFLSTLKAKDLIHPEGDFVSDPWGDQVFEKDDIFHNVPVSPAKLSCEKNKKSEGSDKTLKSITAKLQKLDVHPDSETTDYRISRVEVIPLDMKSDISIANEPLKAKVLGYGVIRLYRDKEDLDDENDFETAHGNSSIVAILGVPFYFTASDLLLGFFDAEVRNSVSHFRILRIHKPNRFMVLVKFRDPNKASTFAETYNGRQFNSMEPEACQTVFVKQILFKASNNKHDEKMNTLPYLLDDPFTTSNSSTKLNGESRGPGTSDQIELPSCPVCLERLDANLTGLLTIPCQHTYHCQCLSKWKDDTCPVCRYSAKFDVRKQRKEEQDEEEKCSVCAASENLWICLICGNMGCGRYDLGHAIDHYKETSHCFAMETTSQRVWDYAGDNYVHRLVQNEADGKLVELPLRSGKNSSSLASPQAGVTDDKLEKIGFEYSKLLISQLESQREYYEMKFEEANNKVILANDSLNQLKSSMAVLSKELDSIKNTKDRLEQMQREAREAERKYKEESSLTGALSQKIELVTKENEELKAQNMDLQEQVNDVMFYFTSQEKFKDASDDVKEGQVIVKPPPSKSRRGKSSK